MRLCKHLIATQSRMQSSKGGGVGVNESLFFDHAAMVVFLSNFEMATDPNPT